MEFHYSRSQLGLCYQNREVLNLDVRHSTSMVSLLHKKSHIAYMTKSSNELKSVVLF